MYNMADVTTLLSSNEGWGLALTESMMCGSMIIATVTGGMQDQMRFIDEKGKWFTPSSDIPSNHRGTYKEHGEWAEPVFPANIALTGSPMTPYIYDDRIQAEDAAKAIFKVYELGKEERDKRGIKAREWVTSKEANMTGTNMSNKIADCMDKAFDKFIPRPTYNIHKIEDRVKPVVTHKLTDY